MRILLLSDLESSHTVKWARSLSESGIEVILFGLNKYDTRAYDGFNIKCFSLGLNSKIRNGTIEKLIYLVSVIKVKSLIKLYSPNILHAHYASSYGLIGSLTGFHPFILSVWGSDIINFPIQSFIHKKIIISNLRKSDAILATSRYLAKETAKYTSQEIKITPFGVDVVKFCPAYFKKIFNKDDIVIGTVKLLEKVYGIDQLLLIFSLVKKLHENLPLKLLIVGGGSSARELKELSISLGIDKDTVFTGAVDHDKIAEYHNEMDIELFLSEKESFGVSVVEAMACGIPVIVSNIGGLPEIVDHCENGFVVDRQNINEIIKAAEKLILDIQLRRKLGSNGREKVLREYNWKVIKENVLSIYMSIISN